MNNIKPRLTHNSYAAQQIQDLLDKNIIYEAQIAVVSKTLEMKDKKEAAMKALTALNEQVKATNEQLKAWGEYYEETSKETK